MSWTIDRHAELPDVDGAGRLWTRISRAAEGWQRPPPGRQNIRVNAISAGPIKTLAASGISGMRHLIKWARLHAPLKRNTTTEDVGRAALSLISDLGQGITGEIVHVDNGYNLVGMVAIDEALRSILVLTDLGQQYERQQDIA
jgi:enoyl-ACP reductase-like protein